MTNLDEFWLLHWCWQVYRMRGHILHGPRASHPRKPNNFRQKWALCTIGSGCAPLREALAISCTSVFWVSMISASLADKSQGRGKTIRLQTEACTLWSARLASAQYCAMTLRWVLTRRAPATFSDNCHRNDHFTKPWDS